MVSTSSQSFLQSPLPTVNRFSSNENSVLSPSSVRFRQSSNITAAAATCASIKTEFGASSSFKYSTATLPPTASPTSFYEILGIPRGVAVQEIKAAYRRLARVCHPDVVASVDQKELLAEEFMKINAAYCTLSDPKKRADYDHSLSWKRRDINLYSGSCVSSGPSAMSGFTGYITRKWETDQCW